MDIVILCWGGWYNCKKKRKNSGKYKWRTLNVIPLISLVGINIRQPILHKSKTMVHCYSTDEIINTFTIGHIINPSLNCNKEFREQVRKWLSVSFHENTMETIKDCLRNNNTCVMALIMFYENNGLKPKKVYRVLSCVVYYLVYNYVCIDYLSFQSKTLS